MYLKYSVKHSFRIYPETFKSIDDNNSAESYQQVDNSVFSTLDFFSRSLMQVVSTCAASLQI